jgi:CRP-like cAMP-binding protein
MISIEQLKTVEAFKAMNDEQLRRLVPVVELLEFPKGHKLFKEGDPAEHLWLVLKGQVDLRFELPDGRPTTEEHTVSSVVVGKRDPVAQTFGWSCFVPPFKMRLSAYCVADACNIMRIAKADLIRLFDEDPLMGYEFLTYLITVVGYRFHQFQDVVAKTMGQNLICGW